MRGKQGNYRGKRNEGKKNHSDDDRPNDGKGYQKGKRKPYRSNDDTEGFERKDNRKPGKRSKKRPFADNAPKGNRPAYEKSDKIKKAEAKYASKGKGKGKRRPEPSKKPEQGTRLNKYIANAGVCSRRDADKLIAAGDIKVNNTVITEMGFRVNKGDKVTYKGKKLKNEKPVYVLLNKPKDFITTTDDPQQRKTVMDLVSQAGDERIFPVGRLDRQTTGLLLLTNDGELAEKLAHPANNIKKVYQVDLDKPITENDFKAIQEGIKLDDGPVEVDEVVVLDKDRQILGLEIHIGRNRIVRRLFEHLGYDVVRLDRVYYAGLTKKDLSRGHWRYLTEEEVIRLKYLR
ncbi:pseudouridine synthase [Roseivirga sp. BDSF3-8]|uniref:pseudouridine synthase n=1 Tax=Roseivirga sp. BDSF3-8 TaxID=3241598 RepID=UPI003531B980